MKDFNTLQEKVTALLRNDILTQEIKPGERLVQDELASKYGVSRMPIREALRSLEREGLVLIHPYKGAEVVGTTKDDIEELYYIRSILEGITVVKSMNFLTKEDKQQLQRLIIEMDIDIINNQVDEFVVHNKEFHIVLQKGCSWTKIKMLTKEYIEGYPSHVPRLYPDMMSISNQEHKQILKALEEMNPLKLQRLVENHIMRVGNMLTELIK
ncbi:GntR family transcriptional regulator [Schinkia azotoformans]|uniref:GntR family transcriptional regulator n=1 Tax=Schinkia azotoformans TaxID=1454 RepID=UPI002E1DAECB|nr:GntR family transcriptional regulator [Schinkia azotoformans]